MNPATEPISPNSSAPSDYSDDFRKFFAHSNDALNLNLKTALSYNRNDFFQSFSQNMAAMKAARSDLSFAKIAYINSINSQGTQQAIAALTQVLSQLQIKLDDKAAGRLSNATTDYDEAKQAFQSSIASLSTNLTMLNLQYSQLQNFFTKLKADVEKGDKDTINKDMDSIPSLSSFGPANLANSQLSGELSGLIGKINTFANEKTLSGKQAAYTDTIAQIQSNIDTLKHAIDGSVDTEQNLKDANAKYENLLTKVNMSYEMMVALENFQQQATQTINSEQKSFSNLVSNLSTNMTKVNFASSLATGSRLAKLSNPYGQDNEFATYINAMKNQELAANNVTISGNVKGTSDYRSFLAPIVYSYDALRFKKNNNLWGNIGTIIGNSNSVNSVSGVFNFGYDAWVKNAILGVYGSYAYTTDGIANSSSKNQSHNADVGFYSRFFVGKNEIDVNLGESFGFNFLQFQESLLGTTLKSDSVSFQTHLDLTYGYVFKIGNGFFTKPFIGINYNYGYNMGLDAKAADISMGFDPFLTHYGAVQAGVEFRKYFDDNHSYFYIAPAFYQGVLFEDTQAIQTKIYETSFVQNATDFNKNQSLDTSFLIKAGGEFQASENIFVNISVGAKLGNLNQYGMLNLGGRWVF